VRESRDYIIDYFTYLNEYETILERKNESTVTVYVDKLRSKWSRGAAEMIITSIQPRSQRDEDDEYRRFYWKGCLVRLVSYSGSEAAYVKIELQVTRKDKKVDAAQGYSLAVFLPNYKSIDLMIDFDKRIIIPPGSEYQYLTGVKPLRMNEEIIRDLFSKSHSTDKEAIAFEEMKSWSHGQDTEEVPEGY
jgi:hypothetical protein